MKKIIKDLNNRGMIHDISDGLINIKSPITFYVGFDPTSKSLHIGNLLLIITVIRLYRNGNIPIVVIGGSTAMIGDPSDKKKERKFLSSETIKSNICYIKNQLKKIFGKKKCKISIKNNNDWIKKESFISILRKVGKYININYILSKDFIKKRLNKNGISFTEFSYQIIQSYDFFFLYKKYKCALQIGGSDQWGNITSGVYLIKRKLGKHVHGLTFPIISDKKGNKIGKSFNKKNNIWLDKSMTSPYEFYQFWLKLSDYDCKRFIMMYSLLSINKINYLVNKHFINPEKRLLQKSLAREMLSIVHGREIYFLVKKNVDVLFSNDIIKFLKRLEKGKFFKFFKYFPYMKFKKKYTEIGINLIDFLIKKTNFFLSKSQLNFYIKNSSIIINKKIIIKKNFILNKKLLINNCYFFIQKGKKDFLIIVFD